MLLKEQFYVYLTQIGYAKSTQTAQKYHLNSFLNYIKKTIESITTKDIIKYQNYLKSKENKQTGNQLSESSIYGNMNTLKLFFNWLETNQIIPENPISPLRFKKPKTAIRTPLTKEEIKELFEAANSLQEIAMLHLFYSCGLRRSEAANLNTKDIHFTNQILYVRSGKGKKRRVVPITDKVSKALENYIISERSQTTETEAFIINRRGKRMDGYSYNTAFKKLKERTNIIREVSPHYLRHSIATHLLASGLSIENVRQFLGHSDLSTTQIYTKVNLRNYEF
jgi:integrase/recombinase XerD